MTSGLILCGSAVLCRLERADLEDGSFVMRPVIRLKDGLIILTRIDPSEKKTSMLLRYRRSLSMTLHTAPNGVLHSALVCMISACSIRSLPPSPAQVLRHGWLFMNPMLLPLCLMLGGSMFLMFCPSPLLRVRPGWEELRGYLAGEDSKQR